MLKAFKKTIIINCRGKYSKPTREERDKYITDYCAEANWPCEFVSDKEVIISGERYEILVCNSSYWNEYSLCLRKIYD